MERRPAGRKDGPAAEIAEAIEIIGYGNGGVGSQFVWGLEVAGPGGVDAEHEQGGRRLGAVIGDLAAYMDLHSGCSLSSKAPLNPRQGWKFPAKRCKNRALTG
jgi:hypothetical protein